MKHKEVMILKWDYTNLTVAKWIVFEIRNSER